MTNDNEWRCESMSLKISTRGNTAKNILKYLRQISILLSPYKVHIRVRYKL